MIYVSLYLVAIVLANASIAAFGASIAPLNAFLFIAFDLTARDALHDAWQYNHLWLRMFALVLTGSLLSALLAPAIALASFSAFLAAGLVDALVYQAVRRYPTLVRMNVSNAAAAAVDSVVFVALAFGTNPLLWGIILSSYAAKLTGGLLWSVVIQWMRRPRLATA